MYVCMCVYVCVYIYIYIHIHIHIHIHTHTYAYLFEQEHPLAVVAQGPQRVAVAGAPAPRHDAAAGETTSVRLLSVCSLFLVVVSITLLALLVVLRHDMTPPQAEPCSSNTSNSNNSDSNNNVNNSNDANNSNDNTIMILVIILVIPVRDK